MPKGRIGYDDDAIEFEIPVIQGGMGVGLSLSGLSSTVTNERGFGIIAGAGIGVQEGKSYFNDYLGSCLRMIKQEIWKAREKTDGKIGFNLMNALRGSDQMARVVSKEGIDAIFSGGGLPKDLPEMISENSKVKLVPIVSSARTAEFFCKHWSKRYKRFPDAIVVEGPKAGGHLGFLPEQINEDDYQLEKLIPQVLEVVSKYSSDIPVFAAGGIYTGEDIYNIMKIGASGVQMGTIFVTTEECDAPEVVKNEYLRASEEDIAIISSPMGMPGRAVMNDFLRKKMGIAEGVKNGKIKPFKLNCKYHCINKCQPETSPYCIFSALSLAHLGKIKHGFVFAGVNAWKATEIVTVKHVMDNLRSQYEAVAT